MRHERSIQLIPDDLDRADAATLRELNSITPETLRQHDILGAYCSLCKHAGKIDRLDLSRRWPGVSLMALEYRLLCRHCRNKGNNKFTATRLPRD